MESYAGMVGGALEDLAPEERHQIYKLLRLGVRYRPDWPLEITGVFRRWRKKRRWVRWKANFPRSA